MRPTTLGIIAIGAGLVIIFTAIVSYVDWQRKYDEMTSVLQHYNQTKEMERCRYLEQPCLTPTLPAFDSTITIRLAVGSAVSVMGGLVFIFGMKKEKVSA